MEYIIPRNKHLSFDAALSQKPQSFNEPGGKYTWTNGDDYQIYYVNIDSRHQYVWIRRRLSGETSLTARSEEILLYS